MRRRLAALAVISALGSGSSASAAPHDPVGDLITSVISGALPGTGVFNVKATCIMPAPRASACWTALAARSCRCARLRSTSPSFRAAPWSSSRRPWPEDARWAGARRLLVRLGYRRRDQGPARGPLHGPQRRLDEDHAPAQPVDADRREGGPVQGLPAALRRGAFPPLWGGTDREAIRVGKSRSSPTSALRTPLPHPWRAARACPSPEGRENPCTNLTSSSSRRRRHGQDRADRAPARGGRAHRGTRTSAP
jgi:hypothetical protein